MFAYNLCTCDYKWVLTFNLDFELGKFIQVFLHQYNLFDSHQKYYKSISYIYIPAKEFSKLYSFYINIDLLKHVFIAKYHVFNLTRITHCVSYFM